MTTAWWEYMAVAMLGLVLLVLLLPAVLTARAVVRDDLRRTDLTNLKRALEQYYNTHNYYGTPPAGEPARTESGHGSWFFGDTSPLLTGQFIDAIPHDVREYRGFSYRYCVTIVNATRQATGYYLEARLETEQAPTTGFDEDEERKFHYRILQVDDQTRYRVCGGEEYQCHNEGRLR